MNKLPVIPQEDIWRAATYRLLGNLLAKPPASETLKRLGRLEEEKVESEATKLPLAKAWAQLAKTARNSEPASLNEEFHGLFIGITGGELIPYGSWYQTGFLMEKPLAQLREDLQNLGIRRQATVTEPEDHAAAQCEVMSLLISRGIGCQKTFFSTHISPWMSRFFQDLGTVENSAFYSAVGTLGNIFLDNESQYFSMFELETNQ